MQIKINKDQNTPGSSHPYTLRQLVLERKLKTVYPQAQHIAPKTFAKIGYQVQNKHDSCIFVSGSEIQRKQLTSSHSLSSEKTESTKKNLLVVDNIIIQCIDQTNSSQALGIIHLKVRFKINYSVRAEIVMDL